MERGGELHVIPMEWKLRISDQASCSMLQRSSSQVQTYVSQHFLHSAVLINAHGTEVKRPAFMMTGGEVGMKLDTQQKGSHGVFLLL